jgi:hypothetical protein
MHFNRITGHSGCHSWLRSGAFQSFQIAKNGALLFGGRHVIAHQPFYLSAVAVGQIAFGMSPIQIEAITPKDRQFLRNLAGI